MTGKGKTPARVSCGRAVAGRTRRVVTGKDRDSTEIVVPVYHREADTRSMFEQLRRVTDGYLLIIVDSGFSDREFLEGLNPLHHLVNEVNSGAIRPVNQGLDITRGEYVCVLHSDLLIYEEGWLDSIVDFMDGRPDVGLVGFAGRCYIKEDGSLDHWTTVINMSAFPPEQRPVTRWIEVATIDGLGWVMRNIGLRLDEGLGWMHFYDLDLSLQYLEAGYKVFVCDVEVDHFAIDVKRSARSLGGYLQAIGGDDAAYCEEVRERFRRKWSHMLPVSRGEQDRDHLARRIEKLNQDLAEMSRELEGGPSSP